MGEKMEKNSNPESATAENTAEEQIKGSKTPERPSVALIIGSEGIKSFCALPFIEYLQEEKITLDLVIGVSGGACWPDSWAQAMTSSRLRKSFPKQ